MLSGCHNDVDVMKQYITEQGFNPSRMKVLMDDGQGEKPDKANILRAFDWLIADARPGDALFLHYSGHGKPSVCASVRGTPSSCTILDRVSHQCVPLCLRRMKTRPLSHSRKMCLLLRLSQEMIFCASPRA